MEEGRDLPTLLSREEISSGTTVVASPESGAELVGTTPREALKLAGKAQYASTGPWVATGDVSSLYLKLAAVF
jgi:hypothetical protein